MPPLHLNMLTYRTTLIKSWGRERHQSPPARRQTTARPPNPSHLRRRAWSWVMSRRCRAGSRVTSRHLRVRSEVTSRRRRSLPRRTGVPSGRPRKQPSWATDPRGVMSSRPGAWSFPSQSSAETTLRTDRSLSWVASRTDRSHAGVSERGGRSPPELVPGPSSPGPVAGG